ncbi:MAG TPA: alpha/beta hydrolase [Caulobacteraceae bacterium]|nr:alpha/beta hydrolase [Caulobacteraceae bacterium]
MQTLTLADGRKLSFAEYGALDGTPVLWAHGGPGSRLEPKGFDDTARAAGFRLVGIDRPGYGGSTPLPGRSIGDWPADALALADHLGPKDFYGVGVSTGGAYALALAAKSARVGGVVACCALADMRWDSARDGLMLEIFKAWTAPSRDAAIAMTEDQFGADGSKLMDVLPPGLLPPADVAALTAPTGLVADAAEGQATEFAQGVVGYVDDRLADGPGWGSFDLAAIRCPVIVLHGEADPLVPPAHARHTAEITPGARLEMREGLGHISITVEVLPALAALRGAVAD